MTLLVSLVSGWVFFRAEKTSISHFSLKQFPYAKAVENEYVFLQTTTENPKHISDVIKVTLKWDNVLFALSLSLLILVIYALVLLNMSKRYRCGTTIILEITSGTCTNCAIIPLISLSLCPSLLEINPPSSISNMYIKDFPSRILITDWTDFKITNKSIYSTIEIPTCTKLSWINRYRVREVMSQLYMAYFLLKHRNITMPIPSISIQKHLEYYRYQEFCLLMLNLHHHCHVCLL